MTTPLRIAVGLFVTLAAAGCSRSGSGHIALSGKVRCGGRPVPPGTLYFVNGSTIVGKVQYGTDGSYFVMNLPPGELGVAISFKPAPSPAAASVVRDGGRSIAVKQMMSKPPAGGTKPAVSLASPKPPGESDLAKKLADAHGSIANPAYRITVASAPAEQKIEIDFPTP